MSLIKCIFKTLFKVFIKCIPSTYVGYFLIPTRNMKLFLL